MEDLFFALILFVIGAWFLLIALDKSRVRRHIEANNNRVLSLRWRLFGRGWLSEMSKEGGNRIYEIEYCDIYGNIHHAWAKTAMFSGVFFAEDIIIHYATVTGRPMTAEEKVLILEDELRRARSGK